MLIQLAVKMGVVENVGAALVAAHGNCE